MAKEKKQCKNCARVVFANDGTPMCNKAIGAVLNLDQEVCKSFEQCHIQRDCKCYVHENKCYALNKLYCEDEACSYYRKK